MPTPSPASFAFPRLTRKLRHIALLTSLCAAIPGHAEPATPQVTIAPYQGNRQSAISYTFDDGLRDQLELAAPMLESCGFRGTFFIITSLVPETKEEAAAKPPGKNGGISWPELHDLQSRGHEIANHTWAHKNLLKLNDEECREEIGKARTQINEKLGTPPLTFCFPGNAQDDRTRAIALENHVAVRQQQRGFGKPQFTTEEANKWANQVIAGKTWGVVMIHGIVVGYDAFSSPEVLRDHLQYVQGMTDKVWVGTFSDVARYLRQRQEATLSVQRTETGIVCSINSPLDPAIYNVPLTLVVEAPGVQTATALGLLSGKAAPVRILPERLLVDWSPADGPVSIDWR